MPIPTLSRKVNSPQQWRSPVQSRPPIRRGNRKLPFNFRSLRSFFKGRWKTIFKIVLGLVIVGFVASIIFIGWALKDLPNPNKIIDRSVALSTKIYDRTGNTVLYDIHGDKQRTIVELSDIPKYLQQATITAEDKNFYQHQGFSITGILRSLFVNLVSGSKVQGGSTLTQQLVKNAILGSEKTYTRKAKELILSYQIERKFTKDEILKLYFNEIPYGGSAYGAEAASRTYFGKSVKDITLPEAAMLAAIANAPTYYSPYGSHKDALIARQQFILREMATSGYITAEDAQKAIATPVEFQKIRQAIIAPHFVMFIREYLTDRYGDLAVEQEGLKVITTLDVDKQAIAENAVKAGAAKNTKWDASNAALVALDPKNGQILAMVGSKDYFDDSIDGQVNVATRPRQPGSSFKPIVYAAAFEKGYTPETVLDDVNTTFVNYDGQDYTPHNYSLEENGPVTIRTALAGSLNVPAVEAIYLAGIDHVIDLAQQLGYTTLADRSRYGLSLVLGGAEVKLLEHTAAYGTFANDGWYHPPVGILEVRDKDGNILEQYTEKSKQVLPSQIVRQITSILSDNAARTFIFGAKNSLTLGDRPVAAKTGTTNDYKDAWTMGYTPSLVAGVWVGNNQYVSMKRGADGSVVAAPIWNQFMREALATTTPESFAAPDPTTTDKPILNGTILQGVTVNVDKVSGMLASDFTPATSIEARTYKPLHSILYYVNKDDPQGATPPDRTGVQYDRWEAAIQDWGKRNNIISSDPPTEFDPVHTGQNQPSVTISNPSSGSTITSRTFNVDISAQAPRGVVKAEYYINNQLIKTVPTAPFSSAITINNPTINSGTYQLKVIVYDDLSDAGTATVDLNFSLPPAPASLQWVKPQNNETINTSDFPYKIRADIIDPANVKRVTIHYKAGDQVNFINTIGQFPGGQLTATWNLAPSPGTYELYADIETSDGGSYQSDIQTINIQ